MSSSPYFSRNGQEVFERIFKPDASLQCKPLSNLASSTRTLKDQNILGILTRCQHYRGTSKLHGGKASHDFSISFSIVDPSRSEISNSIPVVWFFNGRRSEQSSGGSHEMVDTASQPGKPCHMQELLNARIGDIVLLLGVTVTRFNDYPQISGSLEKSALVVFKNVHDYSKGFKLDSGSIPNIVDGQIRTAGDVLKPDDWKSDVVTKSEAKRNPSSLIDISKAVRELGFWVENWLQNTHLAEEDKPMQSLSTVYNRSSDAPIEISNSNNNFSSTIKDISMISFNVICLVLKIVPGNNNQVSHFWAWDSTPTNLSSDLTPISPNNLETDTIYFGDTIEQCIHVASLFSQNALSLPKKDNPHHSAHPSIGIPVLFKGNEVLQNPYINRLKVGQWIEVRNAVFESRSRSFLIKQETTITPVPPFACDVANIADRYVSALLKISAENLSSNPSSSLPPSANVMKAVTQSTETNAHQSNQGHACMFTCLGTEHPAARPVHVILKGWYPTNLNDFIVQNPDGRPMFLFILVLSDDVEYDVRCTESDAAQFLGVCPEEFQSNPSIQVKIEEQLIHFRDKKLHLRVNLKNYLAETRIEGAVKRVKRIGIFKTPCPFSLSNN